MDKCLNANKCHNTTYDHNFNKNIVSAIIDEHHGTSYPTHPFRKNLAYSRYQQVTAALLPFLNVSGFCGEKNTAFRVMKKRAGVNHHFFRQNLPAGSKKLSPLTNSWGRWGRSRGGALGGALAHHGSPFWRPTFQLNLSAGPMETIPKSSETEGSQRKSSFSA